MSRAIGGAGRWRRIGLLAVNDARLATKDRSSLVWMLLLPLGMMWLFGQMGSGGGGTPQISLGIDDRDGGWLARALVAELEDESVALTEVGSGPAADGSPTNAESEAGAGEGTSEEGAPPAEPPVRILVLPVGLTEKILAGETQELRLEVSPDADAAFGMGAQVHIQRAIVRLLGRLLETELGAETDEPLITVAEARYAALATEPPRVTLAVSTAGRGRAVPSGYAQSVPGILTMTVLMMTLIYGGVFLVIEKQQGMLRRQATLPIGRGEMIAGKLIGRLLIAALQVVVLFAAARFLFGIDLGDSPIALALLAASYTVAVAGLSVLLGAVLHTQEQASSLGWILSMVLAGFGGCWWPAELMPEWLQILARAFPTTWAMEGFHALLSFGRGLEGVLLPVVVLLGFGALFTTVAARFLNVD